jgi:hypothetical protein
MNHSTIGARMSSSDALDALLREADPHSGPLDARVLASAAALADDARRAALTGPPPPRRRRWVPFAAAGVVVASFTAGTAFATDLYTNWAVHLEIAGEVVDKTVDADVVIPISFETTSGETVACTYAVAYVWGDVEDITSFVSQHDWSDLGRKAYARHLELPYYPEAVTDISDDGTRRELTKEEILAQGPVFSAAIDAVFTDELPPALREAEFVAQGRTDCDGDWQ